MRDMQNGLFFLSISLPNEVGVPLSLEVLVAKPVLTPCWLGDGKTRWMGGNLRGEAGVWHTVEGLGCERGGQ